MRNKARLLLLAAAAAINIGLIEIVVAAEASSAHGAVHAAGPTDDFSKALASAMRRMHEAMSAVTTTGDPDRDFLALMIPHHAGAVEMARLLLLHGRDPLVRQLAGDIIAAQQAEIAAMDTRLQILARDRDADPGGFPALGGTRGEAPPR